MIETLLIIIMSLAGLSAADVDGKNPTDFGPHYDTAKQIYYDQQAVKDGGIGDSLSGG